MHTYSVSSLRVWMVLMVPISAGFLSFRETVKGIKLYIQLSYFKMQRWEILGNFCPATK